MVLVVWVTFRLALAMWFAVVRHCSVLLVSPAGHGSCGSCSLSFFIFKGAICSLLLVGAVPWWLFYYAYVLWVTWGAFVHAAYTSPCPG